MANSTVPMANPPMASAMIARVRAAEERRGRAMIPAGGEVVTEGP